MSTLANLPQALQASLNKAQVKILLAYYQASNGVVLNPDSAFVYIND
jgi:hypothetical protein